MVEEVAVRKMGRAGLKAMSKEELQRHLAALEKTDEYIELSRNIGRENRDMYMKRHKSVNRRMAIVWVLLLAGMMATVTSIVYTLWVLLR